MDTKLMELSGNGKVDESVNARLARIEQKLDDLKDFLDDIYEKLDAMELPADLGLDFES